MGKAEYPEKRNYPQRDSAEHKEYVGVQSVGSQEIAEQDGADLLERILSRDNLNRAYKRVRANKGAPGIDGMTVEDVLPWLREHREELLDSIRQGKYKPQPVRRKEIPKPDGGVRKLGIPTVIDRIIQQAIAQQLVPIYEPLFSNDSYGYRPGRSAQQAIQKVKQYAEQGYTSAVLVDLSKYFDTLNHELLMNLLRKNIHDSLTYIQSNNNLIAPVILFSADRSIVSCTGSIRFIYCVFATFNRIDTWKCPHSFSVIRLP